MQEYLYGETSENKGRDLLREIDAGELDEDYLIKHAADYGRHAVTHPMNIWQAVVARLQNLTRFSRPKPIDKPVTTVSRPTAQ